MKKVLRILVILLILPQALVAKQIPYYRMDSFALLSEEVFLCEYQVVTAKLIQGAEILAFRQADNPGPLVLFPQNPEQALVADGAEPGPYDFIRDVRLSVAASRELTAPVRIDMLFAEETRQGDGEGAGEWILAHLDRIVIPVVECEGASVEEVIDFARLRSIELDPESAKAPAGISFIICGPDDPKREPDQGLKKGEDPGARRINYVAKNVTLTRLLVEIGQQARLDVHVTDIGIILCAPGHPPFPNAKSQKGRIARTLYEVPKAIEREQGTGPKK